MNNKRIIAVLGATGAQGGGLVRAILNDPNGGFAVRAITRDVGSVKAKELAKAGPKSSRPMWMMRRVSSGRFRALTGRIASRFLGAFFAGEGVGRGPGHGHGARDARLQHVIWSTLEDTRQWVPLNDNRLPTLMGKYKVPHFDAKGEANRVFTELGVPTTFLLTSFYWDNFIHFGMGPKPGANGHLTITLPMADKNCPHCRGGYRPVRLWHFQEGPRIHRQDRGDRGSTSDGTQMAASLGRALGREVRYNAVTPEAYRGFGFPGAEDLGNMFQFKRDFEKDFCGARSLEFSRSVNPALQDFDTWLERNKSRIPVG